MDRAQFENILSNSSKIALLLLGVLGFAVAMALGKFIRFVLYTAALIWLLPESWLQ